MMISRIWRWVARATIFAVPLLVSAADDESAFALRFVHPESYKIVTEVGYAGKIDLSGYEKLETGEPASSSRPSAYWVSKKVEITAKDLKEATLEVTNPPPMTKKDLEYLKRTRPDLQMTPEMEQDFLRPLPPQIVVHLMFNPDGTEKFAELTRSNVGRELAFVVDRKLIMAPVIRSAITDGKAQIPVARRETAEATVKRLKSLIEGQK